MSLRITQSILFSTALQNIQRANRGNFEAGQQLSTGRRVNKPSDDPAALLRIMPLRSELQSLGQTQDQLASSRLLLDGSANLLEGASDTMATLRELTMQAANGTTGEQDRQAILIQIREMTKQVLASANGRSGNRSLFAGSKTDVAPFEIQRDAGGARAVYRGDRNATEISITAGITTEINIPGDEIFLYRNRGATIFDGTTGAAASGAGDSGIGYADLEVSFAGLNIPGGTTGLAQGDSSTTALGDISYVYTAGSPNTLSLNGGPAQAVTGGVQSFDVGSGSETVSLDITPPIAPGSGTFTSTATLSTDGGATTELVDDFSGSTDYQVWNTYDGSVLNVEVSGLQRTGTERVKFEGTFDPFTTFLEVEKILENADGLPTGEVSQRLTEIIGEIDFAHDAVLNGLQELGYRSQNMSVFENRLAELELARRTSLSEIEDADFAEAAIRLSQQEISFQASLSIGARAVQTTLLNFL